MTLLFAGSARVFGQLEVDEAEERIIQYHAKNGLDDAVARLQQQLADGTNRLTFDKSQGYLPSLLKALRVPVSSQALVFSKTSSQADHTSPKTPRAIYFADDVFVAFAPGAPAIDLAAMDSRRGAVFYTLEQRPEGPPKFNRPADCLQCHRGPKTINVPGLIVRSVHTAPDGTALAQVPGFVNGHNSPLEERWGGWYVSGTHAGALHLGNTFASVADPESTDLRAGANVTDLRRRFDSDRYLSPHSDIVALLVLEHQVRMHNLITHANYETRVALAELQHPASSIQHPASGRNDWPHARIRLAGEMLLEYMLCRNETPLKGPIKGTSSFAVEFAAEGPPDSKGRSLRQLDLKTRLLRHPCSFLVYTRSFDALPEEMKSYLWPRLEEILSGRDRSPTYAGMSAEERQAVLEILRETKPEFDRWLAGPGLAAREHHRSEKPPIERSADL